MKRKQEKGLNPLEVMGAFWIALGLIMLVATYAPPSLVGKLTNMMAGMILLAIGSLALLKGRRKRLANEADRR